MASRPKRKFTTSREQDALLEAFYNELDEGKESSLGNRFVDEDDIEDVYELESGSDSSEAENEADMAEVEQEIEQIEEEDVDIENTVKEKTSNESKSSATIQRKQKLKTLDGVLNDNNYDNATPQAEHSFEYTDSGFCVRATSVKDKRKYI